MLFRTLGKKSTAFVNLIFLSQRIPRNNSWPMKCLHVGCTWQLEIWDVLLSLDCTSYIILVVQCPLTRFSK